MSKYRDRIKEIVVLKARELTDNEGNWRMHPLAQKRAMEGILTEIGKSDVLKAYHSERNGGKLTLFDGHLRKSLDPDEEWKVAILDINDDEADKLMLVYDPISAMAEMDREKVLSLTGRVNTDDLELREVMRHLELEAQRAVEVAEDDLDKQEKQGPPAMELLPFEHYDYVLLMFKSELDWLAAIDTLGLEKRSDKRETKKIGLCRVIDGKRVIAHIQELEFKLAQRQSATATTNETGHPQS